MATEHGRIERVIGALVGSVVGDALGAPFEFGGPGGFSECFPNPVLTGQGEMVGEGVWKPGEWTDDTQMALLVAESLGEQGDLVEEKVFESFQEWAAAGPKDIGVQTGSVLKSGLPWSEAAAAHFAAGNLAAGNGSLMRTMPAAIRFACEGPAVTMEAARKLSSLTHGDPAAGEGCAIYHELVRRALAGEDSEGVLAALPEVLALVAPAQRAKWAKVLAPGWKPSQATEANGAVWPALGTAVWALRQGFGFAHALREVIDLGGDTDTVACITGGLLGAVQGIGAIPSRWTTPLHGELVGHADSGYRYRDLQDLARALDGHPKPPPNDTDGAQKGPQQVAPLLWLANIDGAAAAISAQGVPPSTMVISLCRTWGYFDHHPERREVYLVDTDDPAANGRLDEVVDDVLRTIDACHAAGQDVLVHCHGGASRTGLVHRAWRIRSGLSQAAADSLEHSLALWPHTSDWNSAFEALLEGLG